jgi:hypothetical protein
MLTMKRFCDGLIRAISPATSQHRRGRNDWRIQTRRTERSLPYTNAPPHQEQPECDVANSNRDQSPIHSPKQHPMAMAHQGSKWTRGLRKVSRMCNKSWTVETLSFIVSILTLAGLVATLLKHQHKPLPQWPQLVNINSIISPFPLLMRSCVGVVLAEVLLQSPRSGAYVVDVRPRYQSVQMELVYEGQETESYRATRLSKPKLLGLICPLVSLQTKRSIVSTSPC